MRVLIYGMQSSGASAITFTAAQKPDCVAFVDIWSHFAAPQLGTSRDVVAKVVVTTAFPRSLHRGRFRPDYTILVLRHPADVNLAYARSCSNGWVFRSDRGMSRLSPRTREREYSLRRRRNCFQSMPRLGEGDHNADSVRIARSTV
jgi:hypothetical protein